MRTFPLAKYIDTNDMQKCKAEYYEELCQQLINHLHETEDIRMDIDTGDYYWTATGEIVGYDL